MSKNHYEIEYQEDPNPHDRSVLFNGLNAVSFKAKALSPMESFGFFIKDEQGVVLGGATCLLYYGCMYVAMLWVDEKLRYQGYGTKLMLAAEDLAKNKNCSFATVNTMDWEALAFYQKLGYEIEFVREGYQKNSKLYMLRKSINAFF